MNGSGGDVSAQPFVLKCGQIFILVTFAKKLKHAVDYHVDHIT